MKKINMDEKIQTSEQFFIKREFEWFRKIMNEPTRIG